MSPPYIIPQTTVTSSRHWKIRRCLREHTPFPMLDPHPSPPSARVSPVSAGGNFRLNFLHPSQSLPEHFHSRNGTALRVNTCFGMHYFSQVNSTSKESLRSSLHFKSKSCSAQFWNAKQEVSGFTLQRRFVLPSSSFRRFRRSSVKLALKLKNSRPGRGLWSTFNFSYVSAQRQLSIRLLLRRKSLLQSHRFPHSNPHACCQLAASELHQNPTRGATSHCCEFNALFYISYNFRLKQCSVFKVKCGFN